MRERRAVDRHGELAHLAAISVSLRDGRGGAPTNFWRLVHDVVCEKRKMVTYGCGERQKRSWRKREDRKLL
jgi:hypothetical protein